MKEEQEAMGVQLEDARATIGDLQEEMRWMREELLRLTTNPCACK
jgi:hypothetical protein